MFQTSRLMCVLAVGAMSLAAQVVPADTVKTTAMVGIATGETARLNLLNPGVVPVPAGLTCTAAVTFYDGAGAVRKTATVTIAPGTDGYVDLHSDTDLALPAATRIEIRATFAIPTILPPGAAAGTAPTPACQLVANLEIFDNITLRTEAVVGKVETIN